MKKILFSALFIATILLINAGFRFTSANVKHAGPEDNNGFAVIELFTSEGCSSCPAADKAVAKLLSGNDDHIYVLAYHVDYWNRLGWKDVFSKHEFSERQQRYASKFSSQSVYTPQVVVNGSVEFVGSDENKLNNSIANGLQKGNKSDLHISAAKTGDKMMVSYDIDEKDMVLLNIALLQPEATTDVKRGENGGKMLHHVNIVRALKTVDAKGKGNIAVDIPKELSGSSVEVIAFTQSKSSFHILGADKKRIGR